MWKLYFKLKGVKPGKIFVHQYGMLDFAGDALPVEVCKKLYDKKYPFLELTEKGKEKFYPKEMQKKKGRGDNKIQGDKTIVTKER